MKGLAAILIAVPQRNVVLLLLKKGKEKKKAIVFLKI